MHTAAVCLIVLLSCAPAAAQGLQMGVRGGATIASVTTDGEREAGFDPCLALVGGAFATRRFAGPLEVQAEVLYASKGAEVEANGITSRLLLEYLEVPVLARWSRGAFGGSRMYVAAGPAFAYRLRGRTRAEFSGSTEEIDITEDVEPFDLGMALGAGVEIGRWVLDGRYTLGISDIDADASDTVSMKNRALSFSAGFTF